LADVFVSAWRVGFKGLLSQSTLDGLDVNASRARWEADLAPERAGPPYVLAAEFGEVVCGLAVYGPSRDADANIDSGEVFALHVLPSHWGRGAGAALLRTALEELGAHGSTEARLWVIDENTRARRFYEHNGWRCDGNQRDRSIGDGLIHEVRYRIDRFALKPKVLRSRRA
jgi:GNAT superfamily N-acetyltransferase